MNSSKTLKNRIDNFAETCRRHGIKATHQRMEIFRELAGTGEHPDADTIYRRVKKRIPAISLDTVYRTLRLLEEIGIISRVGFVEERTRFDANTDHHYHFVCTECGLVRDFYSTALDEFRPPAEASELGEVDEMYLEVRGICRKCTEKIKKN